MRQTTNFHKAELLLPNAKLNTVTYATSVSQICHFRPNPLKQKLSTHQTNPTQPMNNSGREYSQNVNNVSNVSTTPMYLMCVLYSADYVDRPAIAEIYPLGNSTS